MPQVVISSCHDCTLLPRQTPGGTGVWGDYAFRPAQRSEGDDWLVVYDDVGDPVPTDLPISRRVIVATEPPGIKVYRPGFLEQFGVLLSPSPREGFSGRYVKTDVGHPWMIDIDFSAKTRPLPIRWSFEEVEALPIGEKKNILSAVISTKSQLPRHRRRVEFVKELAARMGDRFHLYGRGFIEIDCKATAILPYSHHLVIENNAEDSFFTEKVCDAFLGWSLPVFSGSEDIEDFFPAESMIRFDMDAPDAIDRVVAALDVPVDAGRRGPGGGAPAGALQREPVRAASRRARQARGSHGSPTPDAHHAQWRLQESPPPSQAAVVDVASAFLAGVVTVAPALLPSIRRGRYKRRERNVRSHA